ncbi:MAG: DUF1624 domain-containing protein [Clostridiales bacterium]|nr:DUF1624 domain-containing protein [Clostridiales bacterium]
MKDNKTRAFELDLLRGVAIIMMVFMHLSYDVRYEFGQDIFSYLESSWFWVFVHPIITGLFVSLSGICCSMSRNNFKRGLKLLAVALAFTVVTSLITRFTDIYILILFNVLHVLAVSIIIYALVDLIEKKTRISSNAVTLILALTGIYIVLLNNNIHMYDYSSDKLPLLIFGITVDGEPAMADYMPLIPWAGVFLIGSSVGRILYSEKKTLFPDRSEVIRKFTRPLEFLGRHSLLIYLVHQVVGYGILWLIFKIAGKI